MHFLILRKCPFYIGKRPFLKKKVHFMPHLNICPPIPPAKGQWGEEVGGGRYDSDHEVDVDNACFIQLNARRNVVKIPPVVIDLQWLDISVWWNILVFIFEIDLVGALSDYSIMHFLILRKCPFYIGNRPLIKKGTFCPSKRMPPTTPPSKRATKGGGHYDIDHEVDVFNTWFIQLNAKFFVDNIF